MSAPEPHQSNPTESEAELADLSYMLSHEEREIEAITPKLTACLGAGRAAYLAMLAKTGDVGTCGFAWVAIEIIPETKPAIRWLNENDHGRIDGYALDFKVHSNAFLQDGDDQVQSLTVQEAGCEALAAALREAGCPCRVESRVD